MTKRRKQDYLSNMVAKSGPPYTERIYGVSYSHKYLTPVEDYFRKRHMESFNNITPAQLYEAIATIITDCKQSRSDGYYVRSERGIKQLFSKLFPELLTDKKKWKSLWKAAAQSANDMPEKTRLDNLYSAEELRKDLIINQYISKRTFLDMTTRI